MCSQHVAVFETFAYVAVAYPVGVLSGHAVVAVLPVLYVEVACRVVYLIHLDFVPVVAAGEEVCAYDGVHVCTLVYHVPIVLIDVACVEVKGHLVVEECGGIADVEVVAVVAVVGDDTLRVDSGCRCVGLALVIAGRECHGVGCDKSGVEEVVGHVVSRVVVWSHSRTPAP